MHTRVKICCISSIAESRLAVRNGAAAIAAVEPYGVDVCSGVRTDVSLDAARLETFFAAVVGAR